VEETIIFIVKKDFDIIFFLKYSITNEEINMKGSDPCGDFANVSSARTNNSILPDVISAQT